MARTVADVEVVPLVMVDIPVVIDMEVMVVAEGRVVPPVVTVGAVLLSVTEVDATVETREGG